MKYKIYSYAIKGYAQSRIAQYLGVTPPYVCKVIKELKKEGYLKEICNKITVKGIIVDKKTKPILYETTGKIYPIYDKLTNLTSRAQDNYRKLVENPRLNLISLQYEIIQPLIKNVPGHSWTNNNTTYLDYKKEFECGQVAFRIISNTILVLWLPEKVIDKRHIRGCTPKIYDKAQIYANWFQKRFGCKLGPPEVYQDYHIAFQEDDPLLCDYVARYGPIKVVDAEGNVIHWWDKSRGYPEFETHDERIAEAKALAPEKIIWLEDKINGMESAIVDKVVSALEEKMGSVIENKLSSIIEKQLSNFFDKSRPQDGFEDVT